MLNSISNAIIYDLENRALLDKGLSNASFSGIVEGYFNQDELSADLRRRLEEYRRLKQKPRQDLSDEDFMHIALLETSLEEIPDYIDVAISAEFHKLKFEFDNRKD